MLKTEKAMDYCVKQQKLVSRVFLHHFRRRKHEKLKATGRDALQTKLYQLFVSQTEHGENDNDKNGGSGPCPLILQMNEGLFCGGCFKS